MSSIPPEIEHIEIRLLLDAIFLRYHYDFRSYSMASLQRRLEVARIQLGCATLSAVQAKLMHDPAAFAKILQYLTVQVSDLFRDPEFFLAFRQRIVPVLSTYPSLKLWIAGCSSGEEVYSYAILLREEGLLDRAILYATDINPDALQKAEAGIYPDDRLPTFEENYKRAGGKAHLSDYYTAAYGSLAFDRTLRKRVVFSDHSLATDNVFAEVQLVSCRNVLIYFDRPLQDRVFGLIRDSLCRNGFLGLGTKETLQLSPHASAFQELVAGQRWYQRR